MATYLRSLPDETERFDPARIAYLIVAHILAVVGLFNFTWQAFTAFFVLYIITGVGITFGYHRLFTHRSFKVPRPLEIFSALAATLAMQGNILRWVVHHRMHHAYSDKSRDPHDATRGFWYSHIVWVCQHEKHLANATEVRRFGRDITADPVLMLMSTDTFMVALQVLLGAGLWIFGGWEVMLWGIWVRVVAVYHATWFVNSAAHKWGYRNYRDADSATNCWWVSLITFGEGWHNNHHAHSNVAPAGRKWWEFDMTWQLIKLLSVFGLATDIKLPPDIERDPSAFMKVEGALKKA